MGDSENERVGLREWNIEGKPVASCRRIGRNLPP
jgi:hypothetical protein